MEGSYRFLKLILTVVVLFLSIKGYSQPLPCPPSFTTYIRGIGDTTFCAGGTATLGEVDSTSAKSTSSYTYSTIPYLPTTFTGGTSVLLGVDDEYSALIPLPFPFCFYGTKYNSCVIGANGEICFNASLAGGACPWSIPGPIPTAAGSLNAATLNTIMGVYQDIDPAIGGTISWNVYGTAPCRTFVVSWNKVPYYNTGFCPTDTGTQQIVLYESTYAIDIFIHHKPYCTAWNSGWADLGIVDATGANYNIPSWYNATVFSIDDSGYRFTPNGAASWTYRWAGPSGIVGTSATVLVSPTVTTVYTVTGVASTNCDSFPVQSTVTVTVGGTFAHAVSINPSRCGATDGAITITGLTPGLVDTVNYSIGGVPQPTLISVVSSGGTIVLAGLCAGSYSLSVKEGYCTTPLTVTLSDPSISLTGATPHNPTQCGNANGYIALHGLYPSHSFSVSYTFNGIAQPPVVTFSNAAGNDTLFNLCAGVYDNIVASYASCSGSCTTPAIGPYTLTAPAISISGATPNNPSRCGASDGSIVLHGLYPAHAFTVAYNYNGVTQPPVSVISGPTGNVVLSGLCAGIYDNIIAGYVQCTACATPSVGSYTLTDPALSFGFITDTDATACGVCDGKIVLNGLYPSQSYSVSYSYNGTPQPSVNLTSDTGGVVVITGLCDGTYTTLQARFVGCDTCTATNPGPFTISFPPPPPVNLVSYINPNECGVCNGTIKILSVTPFTSDTVTYWLNGVAQPYTIVYASADSGVYVTGLCPGTYSNFQVKVGPCMHDVVGSATLIGPSMAVGFSPAIHYGCTKDTVYFINSSASTGALYYTWNFGDSTSDVVKNPIHAYSQGVYSVTLVATNHYCTDTASATLNLFHPINAGFKITPASGIICQGQSVAVSDSSTATSPSYLWSFGNGATSTQRNPEYTYNNTGRYKLLLVLSDFVPCTDTASVLVQVDSVSPLRLSVSDSVFCKNTYVTFTGDYSTIGNKSVVWNFGDGDSVLNQNPVQHQYNPGIYTVTLNTHYRTCRDTSASMNVKVNPAATLYIGEDTSICPGSNSITLQDNQNAGNPQASWIWNTGQSTSSIVVTQPGYYWATVTINNCQASDTVWVRKDCYIDIPNVFTPNGDGINDYFFPRQLLTSGLTTFKMEIFNRWGQLLFTSSSLDGRGWDGTFNGILQPEGVYVYIIDATFKDGQKEHHQGNVTLLK